MTNVSALIPAEHPAALWEVLFRPSFRWVIDACRQAGIPHIRTLLPEVEAAGGVSVPGAEAIPQTGPKNSPLCAVAFLEGQEEEHILVVDGTLPLLDPDTIRAALSRHLENGNQATRLVFPQGAAKESPLACWYRKEALLGQIRQGGGLIPEKAEPFPVPDPIRLTQVTDRVSLLEITRLANRRIIEGLLESGVEFLSLDGILIGPDVTVGEGTRILPGTILRDGASVGRNCVIGPNSLVSGSRIGDGSVFNASQCYQAEIGSRVTIGPFCHLRPASRILDGVHIGDFVEVKNSVIGEETHISHLTYVGDSDVGKKVNFGCGVATANYDGVKKARCVIGDHAFIGCNTNLVAPVTIGENGYTAAGSTITEEVPAQAMGIARARQVNKEGYNRKIRG